MTERPTSPWPMRRDGLLFREATEAEVAVLLTFRNDPDVNRFMVRTPVDPDDLRREWLAVPGSATDFSCVVERDGAVVAMGFLDVVDGSGQPGFPRGTEGVIGYVVRPLAAGQGIGTATARALLGAAFDGLSLRRVTARANLDNLASVRVLEKRACGVSATPSRRCGTTSSGGWTRSSTRSSTRSGRRAGDRRRVRARAARLLGWRPCRTYAAWSPSS